MINISSGNVRSRIIGIYGLLAVVNIGAWDLIESLDDSFGTLGFAITGVFGFSWIASVIIYRVNGFDRLESTSITTD